MIGVYCFIAGRRFSFKAEHLDDKMFLTDDDFKKYVIFSSIVCGGNTKGMDIFDAVNLATNFIYCSIKNTPTELDYEPNGVNFQKQLEMLINAK